MIIQTQTHTQWANWSTWTIQWSVINRNNPKGHSQSLAMAYMIGHMCRNPCCYTWNITNCLPYMTVKNLHSSLMTVKLQQTYNFQFAGKCIPGNICYIFGGNCILKGIRYLKFTTFKIMQNIYNVTILPTTYHFPQVFHCNYLHLVLFPW